MRRWQRGEAEIERLLAAGELQSVRGDKADGAPWAAKARKTLTTAGSLIASNPESAVTLAYESARFACCGVLAQQGLRPTTRGGHYGLERAVVAQFGEAFTAFGPMRRRRNELEYPEYPDEMVEPDEAELAVASALSLLDSADKLLPHLGIF